ncbi:hypothetical protein ZYGR_0N02260 [Zygosaccharomyces rouxii]|uniref:non-specific serine/threonine protein kinase n=2 Tax=Zygosaccharomyces rouxii TaxID=4956 RepID=C5DVC1_ZYGRC|nr:uncharacterized protein ZYRO0D05500g [Zygosaccharomyces rouxii]KAH9200653.1 hypothetical protein LQ764DRAFT_233917 [Zygosaccharomyces rouxii]GAV48821.1 hypothetical protein ZYGR_0N02260 [Zygosaccharomyces rouxii]CAR27740.1 ZYRO0D05500p [Zygosaccharomyces rouxii]
MPYTGTHNESGAPCHSSLKERQSSYNGSPNFVSPISSHDSLDTYNNTFSSTVDTTSDSRSAKYMPYRERVGNGSNGSNDSLLENEGSNKLSKELQNQGPPRPNLLGSPGKSQSVNSLVSNATTDVYMDELYELPNKSTHVYSYNPLSPNSLAVRLSILKRSLEIMIKNPHILEAPPIRPELGRNHSDAVVQQSETSDSSKTVQQKGTASAAALKAFVNNTSNSSANASANHTAPNTANPENPSFLPPSAVRRNLQRASSMVFPLEYLKKSDPMCREREDLEDLLVLLNKALEDNEYENATDLHLLSLLNINKLMLGKEGQEEDMRTLQLKKALLDSLAEPFFEHYHEKSSDSEGDSDNDSDGDDEDEEFLELHAGSQSPLNVGIPGHEYGRVLHTFTSGKNVAPQAIFTCSQQHPWAFKAANDLACLTFGVSNNALKALTLLDLIHTDSRNFVLNKIMSTEGQELVFSGEVVAIAQPGNGTGGPNLIWASFWAKRKNGMLVCVFQKVPCDYVDVLLDVEDYSIKSVSGGGELFWGQGGGDSVKSSTSEDALSKKDDSGNEKEPHLNKKKTVKFVHEHRDIKEISASLAQLIDDVLQSRLMAEDDDLLPMPIRVANHVNDTRYFTLNNLSNNIPGAVSLTILNDELKLKIHSLPYEAGLFVIDSHSLNLISSNKSIFKNMFGRHFADMAGKPITNIIPSFANMIQFIRASRPSLNITSRKNRGLVLSEHFFRKIQAEMNGDPGNFYTSVGIGALHRDGFEIKVDLQLRVMSSRVILLWITHSRDVVVKDYTSTPSQLRILKENELAYVSSTPSSRSSSKRSSSKISLTALKEMASHSTSANGDYDKQESTDSPNDNDNDKNEKDKDKDEKLDNDDKEGTATAKDNDDVERKPGIEDDEKSTTTIEKSSHPVDVENDGSVDIGNSELQRKLELTKIYSRDKSRFVNDGNFKLDQDLIRSITSMPTEEVKSDNISTRSDSAEPIFLHAPVDDIGAQKHTKKYSDFVVLQKMGEGAYGKVNLCLHKKKRYIVVIKLIIKERILVDTWVRDRKLGTIPSEIQIMAALNKHPDGNILTLIDFFEDDDYYYIETPVHGETGCIDLFDLIELKTNMTEYEAKLIFRQVVSAIRHLHSQGIVHRDIKDENVVVDSKGFVKLIDFGSAAYVKSGPFDVFVGTIDYAAPEVLSGEPFDGKPQDIWAIGVLLYTIVFKENPFYNIDEILEVNLKFHGTKGVSEECINLIKMILNKNPSQRPTIDEVYNNEWSQI